MLAACYTRYKGWREERDLVGFSAAYQGGNVLIQQTVMKPATVAAYDRSTRALQKRASGLTPADTSAQVLPRYMLKVRVRRSLLYCAALCYCLLAAPTTLAVVHLITQPT
jgi:hypothetical protein